MEELNPEQWQRLRALLEQGVERLRVRIAHERERLVEEESAANHGDDEDEADRAFADLRADIQCDLIGCHVAELQIFEAALARVGAGKFGLCVDCGTQIPYARLEAQPAAERCARCQGPHEKAFAKPARAWR